MVMFSGMDAIKGALRMCAETLLDFRGSRKGDPCYHCFVLSLTLTTLGFVWSIFLSSSSSSGEYEVTLNVL
jgi:hypothetical protein